MALLDPINALADAAPGFFWRHTDATPHTVGLLGDPCLLVNLSVWESIDAPREFTYGTATASAHPLGDGAPSEVVPPHERRTPGAVVDPGGHPGDPGGG